MFNKTTPIEIEFITNLDIQKSNKVVLLCFQSMEATLNKNTPDELRAKLGSSIKMRLLGLAANLQKTFPREITVNLVAEDNKTKVNIQVRDNFGFGSRIGISKKISEIMRNDGMKIKDTFPNQISK